MITVVTTLVSKPATAETAPPVPAGSSTWWDSTDPSFEDRPSQPRQSDSGSAKAMSSASTSSSDPRFKCTTPPAVTLQAGQFLVSFGYFGEIDIDPGSTGKTYDELRSSFGRKYTYIAETVGYNVTSISRYTLTGRPSPISTSVASVKVCYMDFVFREWGYSELAQSEWKKTGASFDTYPSSVLPDSYRVIGAVQLLMKVNG